MAIDDKPEGGDAPLIDLNEASIKKLIARAKRRGVITVDELNEALPQDQMSADQIEDIMSAISEMGVNIVESDEDAIDPEEKEVDEVDEPDPVGSDSPVVEKKKETIERTDDPVRMYLRRARAAPAAQSGAHRPRAHRCCLHRRPGDRGLLVHRSRGSGPLHERRELDPERLAGRQHAVRGGSAPSAAAR